MTTKGFILRLIVWIPLTVLFVLLLVGMLLAGIDALINAFDFNNNGVH